MAEVIAFLLALAIVFLCGVAFGVEIGKTDCEERH